MRSLDIAHKTWLPTAFKKGDFGIHLHIEYDPVKESVLSAQTYQVPNLGDEPPPPSPEVLAKIEEKASEVMQENGLCRQKIAEINRALRDAPKLPQDLFGPAESGMPTELLLLQRDGSASRAEVRRPSRWSRFL
ncbi:unnamed protein product [Effrenium voratum]|uniref:Uncharacterized protein n=1 Tax=Effrenium voratum TaxID=2562239 RepID=A0AA36I2N5_9DINO|nr:unnamed protein product [Effrenium voratum]CAJ1461039.1 unnamed protein product [Effrenium voratum]